MRRKNLILWFLALLAVPAFAQDSTPKVIDSRLSLGLYATRTSPLLPQTLDIDDPTASFQVFQVRPTTSSTYPFATFKHRTTLTGADVSNWTFFTDSSAGFNIRDAKNAATRVTIGASGVMAVPGGVTASLTGNVTGNVTGNITGAITTTGITTSGATGAGIQGNTTVFSLTDGAAAATFATFTVASNSYTSGNLEYVVEANNATDYQTRSGILQFSAVNKAGTSTCAISTPSSATEAAALSSGTLANTFSCADAGSGVINLKTAADTSLTVGAGFVRIRYRVNITGTATVAAQ